MHSVLDLLSSGRRSSIPGPARWWSTLFGIDRTALWLERLAALRYIARHTASVRIVNEGLSVAV
jgi:hypothetical protein